MRDRICKIAAILAIISYIMLIGMVLYAIRTLIVSQGEISPEVYMEEKKNEQSR